nr:MAG TPA: hypothetical protein [Caudoviricetes sp.]
MHSKTCRLTLGALNSRRECCVGVPDGLGGCIEALVGQQFSGAIVKRFTVPLFQVAYRHLFESDFAVSGNISTS